MSGERQSRVQGGFSLVEVLVAITIGLLLLAGVVQVFVTSKGAFTLQQGGGRAQESGRIGMYVLTRTLRHTGYYRDPMLTSSDVYALFPSGIPMLSGTHSSTGDSITVSYQGHEDGTVLDCFGTAVTCDGGCDVSHVFTVTNKFSLGTPDSNGIRSLECTRTVTANKGSDVKSASSTQPIIEGVSNFQVLYGIDSDGDLIPDRYVQSPTAAQWNQVMAIQLALTTNSIDQVGAGGTDQRLQQTYSDTVFLRNNPH